MPLVVPNEGERRMLEYIVNKSSPTNLVLKLYTNSVNLSTDDFDQSNFTESGATGYASVTLAGSNWSVATTSGVSVATYGSSVTFSFLEGASIYGYYVTNSSGAIMWAEEFPSAPFTLPSDGGQISVRPQVQLS